jgi:hypothetical protein
MPDFTVRSDSANVEQIMDQIRARIRDKRGVDYTEEQIRELAQVKLEKFLDPRGVRSDLLEQFRRSQPPPAPATGPVYAFEDTTLFESHRGFMRFARRLLRPILKLFFNPNVLASALHAQTVINRQTVERFDAMEASIRRNGDLYYELLHNMVVELTRMTIEVKNAKMRVESIASRLEFNERRARALESAVVYRPAETERERYPQPVQSVAPPPPRTSYLPSQPMATGATPTPPAQGPAAPEGPGQRSRRRRRRRGRRGGPSAVSIMGEPQGSGDTADGREARPEPIEHAFGSVAHPAEAPLDPAAPVPPAAAGSDPSDDQ